MKKLLGFLQNNFFPLMIALIAGFIVWKNYQAGTWLVGWDSIHPEFDFRTALERTLGGVWRQEQGMGATAAHSHMSDLPRLLILWVLSLFLPLFSLRFVFMGAMLVLGPLGVYFFSRYVFSKHTGGVSVSVPSFLAALFYLLNMGTLQHFFVPFEMFAVSYAFVPWLFYFALKFLREGKRKDLTCLFIAGVLSLPQAYAATLFYAFFAGFVLFIFFYFLSTPKRNVLKRGLVVIALSLALNLHWILPNLYSIYTQSGVVSSSKINTLFSPEAFLRNKQYGDMRNVLVQKNFLFDWRNFDYEKGEFVDLMGEWRSHLNTPEMDTLGYVLIAFALFGVLFSVVKREKVGFSLLAVSVFCLFFLFNSNYFSGTLYDYLYGSVEVFREGLRMPFTKFSIPFSFAASFFFGYFFSRMLDWVGNKHLKRIAGVLFLLLVCLSLVLYMLPAFKGHMVSGVVKNELPVEYFELFDWFRDRSGRAALLPVHTLWGWNYNSWGYEGSGFLSYGIKNPVLDRDFDRWSPYNESFYRQISFSVYSEDVKSFESTLEKYGVKYLILDESVVNPGGSGEFLRISGIKDMAGLSGKIEKTASFGFLTVYEVEGGVGQESVFAPNSFRLADADTTYSEKDNVYSEGGLYVNSPEGETYPFVVFDVRGRVQAEIGEGEVKIFSRPMFFEGEKTLVYPSPQVGVSVNSQNRIEAVSGIVQRVSETFGEGRGFKEAFNCDLKKVGSVFKEKTDSAVVYRAEDGGVSCDFFEYPDLSHNLGYLLRIKGENTAGRGMKVYLYNWTTKRMELEELLPSGKFDEKFFVVPTKEGKGYTLNLETRSFGRIASENKVDEIEIIEIPVDSLRQIRLVPKSGSLILNDVEVTNVSKYGTFLYKVDVEGEGLVVLSQGFDDGWIGFSPGGRNQNKRIDTQVLKKVKVNSWANGWMVEEGQESLVLLFWPQLLQYLGYVFLLAVVIFLLKRRRFDN